MSNRSYSLRSSATKIQTPATRYDERYVDRSSPVRETAESVDNSARLPSPPVQRKLYMAEDEIDDDEEDDEVEEHHAIESSDLDSDSDRDEDASDGHSVVKSPFAHLRRRTTPAHSGFAGSLMYSRRTQYFFAFMRRVWQFLLRNAFMTFNLLWLLTPLGCLLIAIFVPHHLTMAIQSIDVLTTSNPQASAYEKGMLRSIVQEIVDLKLKSLQEEMVVLRNTIVSQEREVEGIRLLYESLRAVNDDTQQKMNVVDNTSVLSIHIEHVVSKHAETLWKKISDRNKHMEESTQNALDHQAQLKHEIDLQQESLESLQTDCASNTKRTADVDQNLIRDNLNEWKHDVQTNLHATLVMEMENRIHNVLRAEKESLAENAERLSSLDITASENPALTSMIVSAVAVASAKKAGTAPDHAALANGGVVVRSKFDFIPHNRFEPTNIIKKLWTLSWLPAEESSRFTSPSLRPLLLFDEWWSGPWWLSRNNARPETALSETMETGSCWSFGGHSGRLSVKFANRIIANSVTINHIPEHIAADFSSAPREFRIFGITVLSSDRVDFVPFGNFSYNRQMTSQQTFHLPPTLSQQTPIDGAMIEITSNHGHPNHTCLYRFQVHGTRVL